MLHSSLHPALSGIHGSGIVAMRDVPAGTAVWWPCPRCTDFPVDQHPALPAPILDWIAEYGYRRADGSLLVPCSGAHLFNHSCDAAVLDLGLAVGIAVRDLRRGDEVTCDYRTFRYEDLWSFECRCGASGCVEVVESSSGALPAELMSAWDAKVDAALTTAGTVTQEIPVLGGDIHEPLTPSASRYG
jgi:hypothetical protein